MIDRGFAVPLIKVLKSRGHSVDPCGIPDLMA
jgi:hypothetical protein